jgi:hypothetical protein
LIISLLFAAIAVAQTETARIQGTVTDQAGAVIPGATVTITATGTGREIKVQTNAEGSYSALSLQPGAYNVTVTQTNFKTIKQDITLDVAQNATLDFKLETGAVNEIVTVSAGAPLVDSTSSAIGNVVESRETVDLPLNGRNVLELARLSPGVTQGVIGGFATGANGDAETYRGRNTGGAALSVNGQRTQANNFLLDGVDNNESLVNTINIFPSAEATQEFRVQTSVAPAEFGRGRRYGSDIPRALDYVIGGLQLNAIFRAQSGSPFDVRVNNRLVNVTGNPYGGPNGQYLNRSAFSAVTTGFGSLERNGLRSPATKQLNLGLMKNFAVTERAKIQFRAEAFNVFNTLQFGIPNTDLNNTSISNGFGTITSIVPFSNRQLQFGLRLEF